jgi:MFS family permease
MVYLALCDIFYWLPYHSYYSTAGDHEDRGKQVGVLFGLITLLSMVAPLVGGILITQLGFSVLYIFATLVMLSAAIPLFFVPELSAGARMTFKDALKTVDKKGLLMQAGDGFLYMHTFVWTIALFYLLGNYMTFGILVTIQLFISALMFLVLGYYLDKGKGLWIMRVGLGLLGFALAMTFYSSSFGVGLYTFAKRTPNTMWFHFFAECGWDIGAAVALSVSALLFILGVPLKIVILFSLVGLVIVFSVLKGFYKKSDNLV